MHYSHRAVTMEVKCFDLETHSCVKHNRKLELLVQHGLQTVQDIKPEGLFWQLECIAGKLAQNLTITF